MKTPRCDPRPGPNETDIPDHMYALLARYAKAPDRLTVKAGGWLLVHEPELGTQMVCLIVRTIHLPAR